MQEQERLRSGSTVYWLFAAAIFLSSFLLFFIQPLLGKHILPWFGGSPSVWMTALFFFITALFVGYLYALVLSRFSRVVQVVVHVGVVAATLISLLLRSDDWLSPITPKSSIVDGLVHEPSVLVLFVLSVSIGLPFILLSATSPLLQQWFSRVSDKHPFTLYAISNTGSLLGLLAYIFLAEPFLSTIDQGLVWTSLFGVFVVLLAFVIYQFLGRKLIEQKENTNAFLGDLTMKAFLRWALLAGVPVIALVTGTAHMTALIAPVPFLWVLPLALYLLSFVLSFQKSVTTIGFINYIGCFAFSFLSILVLVFVGNLSAIVSVATLLVATHFIFAVCHRQLYIERPKDEASSIYYVAISVGGILASVSIILSELYILPYQLEFLLLLFVFAILCARVLLIGSEATSFKLPGVAKKLMFVVVSVLMGALIVGYVVVLNNDSIHVARNFFGTKIVFEKIEEEFAVRKLRHGSTQHGKQYFGDGREHESTSYYTETGGAGRAIEYLKASSDSLNVGIVGLGAGVLASYCRDGDTYTYYEIDPEIVRIAGEYFSYLSMCKGITVHTGDARLLLEEQAATLQPFDLLVIDAYADDVVPVHLLTKEAFLLYKELVRNEGMLAVHISSRYLKLEPILRAAEETLGYAAVFLDDKGVDDRGTRSLWVLFSSNPVVFESEEFDGARPLEGKIVRWTDTYSSMLPIVRKFK